jgi:hypothetical protein
MIMLLRKKKLIILLTIILFMVLYITYRKPDSYKYLQSQLPDYAVIETYEYEYMFCGDYEFAAKVKIEDIDFRALTSNLRMTIPSKDDIYAIGFKKPSWFIDSGELPIYQKRYESAHASAFYSQGYMYYTDLAW